MILDEHMRIKDAATALNINYQTAKSIIRRFRAAGLADRKSVSGSVENNADREMDKNEEEKVNSTNPDRMINEQGPMI